MCTLHLHYSFFCPYLLITWYSSIILVILIIFALFSLSLFRSSAASDLDCIRALFNEKEKELSLAVAKVEELTRQLEELRGRQNAPAGGGSAGSIGGGLTGASGNGHLVTPASAELEKLRRELMVSSRHRLRSREGRPYDLAKTLAWEHHCICPIFDLH